MKKAIILIFILVAVTTFSIKKPDSVELDVSGSYGSLNGFIQIPKGGMNKTSDYHKPTFNQLGMNTNILLNTELNVTYGDWTYYGRFSGTNLTGSKTLNSDMTTHGIKLGKGTNYGLDTPLSFFSFGAKKKYIINDKFSISPIFGVEMETLSYTWSAKGNITMPDGSATNSIGDTRGKFHFLAPAVGLQLDYKITENTSFVALGKGIIPISGAWKRYFYGSAKITHTFFEKESGWFNKTKGYIGVEGYTTKTKDSQDEMQNWSEIKQGPMVTVGFILKIL